jgi:NCAIR mutase (PurE)-related protein
MSFWSYFSCSTLTEPESFFEGNNVSDLIKSQRQELTKAIRQLDRQIVEQTRERDRYKVELKKNLRQGQQEAVLKTNARSIVKIDNNIVTLQKLKAIMNDLKMSMTVPLLFFVNR